MAIDDISAFEEGVVEGYTGVVEGGTGEGHEAVELVWHGSIV
jgi:hypothetical protein